MPILWSKNKVPAIPPIKISGRNTLQVVNTELNIGVKTFQVPSATAFSTLWAETLFCKILSITMIELSTIIPTPNIKPERDMILSEIPINLKLNRVMSKDKGMDKATNNANRHRRMKSTKTKEVKKIAATRFHSKLLME